MNIALEELVVWQGRQASRSTSGKRITSILAMKAQMGNILECVKAYGGGQPEGN